MIINLLVKQNNMSVEVAKSNAAKKALEFIKPGCILGVGTGSTVNYFIDFLKALKNKIEICVSSSQQTTQRLRALGFTVTDLNQVSALDLYVDGADEVDPHKNLIKGGGGAHTLEKLLAVNSKKFICIVDASKTVEFLGRFPVPVEVLPAARSYVARELIKLKAQPIYRENFITDSGNIILDCVHLPLEHPVAMENQIKNITGVIEVGIFAKCKPNEVIIG
jgi:ribose 5-phosphate isomerase A